MGAARTESEEDDKGVMTRVCNEVTNGAWGALPMDIIAGIAKIVTSIGIKSLRLVNWHWCYGIDTTMEYLEHWQ